jgi:hypothetical protein
MANLIVSLLSDQTVPNVQFIKEKQNNKTDFLFVSTPKMEGIGVGKWIQNVCGISDKKLQTIEVEQFSFGNITQKLSNIDFTKYEKIFVNVTGGTKVMSMATTDFFKQQNKTEIYYVQNGKSYSRLFPDLKDFIFDDDLKLSDYFFAYGIRFSDSKIIIDKDYTFHFLDNYLKFDDIEKQIIVELNNVRNNRLPYKKSQSKAGSCEIDEIEGLSKLLNKIEFPSEGKNVLIKEEVKFLTGDWYEQWCYFKIKDKYCIKDDFIKTGIVITNANDIQNELDVVYMYEGKLCVIECKTDIISIDGRNILTETIYKQAGLKENFGLTVQPRIYTLSSKESKSVKDSHISRAKDFKIEIKCKEDLNEFLKNE